MADSGAFEVLYREYYPRVFALCRRFLLTHERAGIAWYLAKIVLTQPVGRYWPVEAKTLA